MKKPFGYIKAQVYGAGGTGPVHVKVPVVMTVIPEVPEVILMKKKWAGIKICDNPLAYRLARTAKVKDE